MDLNILILKMFSNFICPFFLIMGTHLPALEVLPMVPTPSHCISFIEHDFVTQHRVGGGRMNHS